MGSPPPDPELKLETLKLLLYLVPIFGFFPALWSLYRQSPSRREQQVSRTVVILAMGWLLTYGVTLGGAQVVDGASTRLVVTSLLATTGYFVTNLWLMIRLLQGHTPRLPGLKALGDRLP